MVTVEKGQGVYDPLDNRAAERKIQDALGAIKAVAPNITTIAYFNQVRALARSPTRSAVLHGGSVTHYGALPPPPIPHGCRC